MSNRLQSQNKYQYTNYKQLNQQNYFNCTIIINSKVNVEIITYIYIIQLQLHKMINSAVYRIQNLSQFFIPFVWALHRKKFIRKTSQYPADSDALPYILHQFPSVQSEFTTSPINFLWHLKLYLCNSFNF